MMQSKHQQALPSRATVLWRGLTKRCARCGSGDLFERWTKMKPECPRCGLHFEREPGYFAGALAINVISVGGLMIAALVIVLVFTVPDVNVVLALSVLAPIALFGPIVWYPFSKTLWVAVDRAILQRLDPYERPDD